MPDPLAGFVRRHDPDRFLTALFAPPEKRSALFALYAFNHELARAREAVSEPALALIRLQWWREVVEGANRRHEVATPLRAAIEAGALDSADLLPIIDAREMEAEPAIPTLEAWRAYLRGTAGGIAVAAGRLLGAPEPEQLRDPRRRLRRRWRSAQRSVARATRSVAVAVRRAGAAQCDGAARRRGAGDGGHASPHAAAHFGGGRLARGSGLARPPPAGCPAWPTWPQRSLGGGPCRDARPCLMAANAAAR